MSDSDSDSTHAPDISWPVDRPETQQNGGRSLASPPAAPSLSPSFMPGGPKALSSISSRAFCLGLTLGVTSILTIELAFRELSIWRATLFVAILSIFHYLEFYTTARYNPSDAKVSSFLLSSNGSAYNVAHTSALIEFLTRKWLQSGQRPLWLDLSIRTPMFLPKVPPNFFLLGLVLVAVGQGVRTAAMAEAGKSFNHTVQSRKKDDHVLVESGIYHILRHPSYFGFFWWGLGTQIFLGNHICFMAYALILWKFFAARIVKEEQFLVKFFGQDYVRYRQRTPVLIPFIA